MAGQIATMEFPVSINAQISNLKDLRTTLINTLNAAGKDSSLAKTLTKDLAKVNQLISEAEEFTLSPTIDAAGLKALEGTFNKFFRQMQTSLQTIDLASFEQMASADDIARLKELTAEAAKYRRELEAINKSGSAEQTGKVLERTGNQDIAQRGSAYKEFNATATLNKNAAAMGKAADAYAQQAAAMQAGIDKLAQELSQAEANSEKAKNKAKILEQNLAAVNIDTRAADFHHKAGRFATNYSAEQNVKNPTLDTIQSGLRATLESVYAGGKIATDMRATVKDWIKNLLPNVKDVDADNMVKKSVNDLLEDLMEGIFGSDYRSNPNLSYNVHHARILGNAQSYSAREIGRINAQYGVSGGQDLKVISADISRELKQVRAEEREYTSDVDKKLTSWDEATDRQKEFTEAAAGARQLANELENLAKAEQEAARAAKEAQIEENEQNQLDLKNARTSGVKNSGVPGRQNMSDYKTDAKEVFDDAGEVLGGKQAQIDEAAQFTANLKQSIKSWMSAQQIINIVKQGIRQAYQDIQGLDKAMTNIAVVTDMSVSDLWGKINEYMSIAQQYGVSTQGVYEVSQLYYQQGLGTADVMAATTETLKMARIAGMDYAEAADAMTVAIRSFKMEMSDAAHVTDVYSKVAAVTASDSEELAIAMSKTASSAESVGSSFENTTAMLAVMIETTRESAQNLGSALKSIISRYGEMKVGMTVDSEGEALDYNKVDTALQSVGISLKDAQGQFRDFDEVIFELSEKWDSLDSVTQRYIATIMAGNRQQSRFIALVDNWERLDEVAGAAQDSEDAGLLQYVKTLDSLETKITNIKTSFQEFYMSLVNGPVVGAALEGINNILKGFNKLGNWQAILNIAGFIRSVKSIAKLLVSAISPSFSSIVSDFKNSMQEMVEVARQKGYEAGKGYSENYNAGANNQAKPTGGSNSAPAQQGWLSARMIGDKSGKTSWGSNSWNDSKMAGRVQIGGQLVGAAASIIGSSVAKDNQRAGAVISGVGNIAQGASMGAALGPWGAVIGGVIGGLASLPAVLDAFDPASVLKEKLEKAEEALSEANIERAQTKDTYTRLDAYIKKLRQLEATRFDSTESYEEWTALNAEVLEAFPELASSFDEANNAIVDLNRAENSLTEARLAASEAAKKAVDAQIAAALAREKVVKQENNTALNELEKNLDTTLKTVSNYDQYHSSSSDIESAKAYSQERIDAIKASQLAENQYYTGTDWKSAAEQAAMQGQRVFAYTNSYGMTSLSFANSNVANALPFIDSTNTEAINWLVNLANTTDPQKYAMVLANGFRQEFLNKEMLPEYAESGLVSNLGPQDFRYGEINTMNALGNKLLGEFGLLERKSFQSELATDSAIRSSIAQYVSSSFLGIENSDVPYTELAGINQVFQNELIKDFKATLEEKQKTNADFSAEDLWESWTLDNYTTKFANLEKEYKQFYENLNYSGKIEDYNAFIANAGSYDTFGYKKVLKENFGLTENNELYQILTQQFQDEYNSARETFIESLKNVDFIDNKTDIISPDMLPSFAIPKEYMDEVTAYARRIQTYVDEGMMSDASADTLWKDYLAIWNQINTIGDETQQAILRRLLGSADLATPEGVAAFEQAIKQESALEGLDLTSLILNVENLIPDSLVNLTASYSSLMQNIATNIDAQATQISKAGDGFGTLEDTLAFADKTGLELSNFTFDDGKWYVNYSEDVKEKIIASVEKDYETQQKLLEDAYNKQLSVFGADDAKREQSMAQLAGVTDVKKALESLGIADGTEEAAVLKQHWDNYIEWAKEAENQNGTILDYLADNFEDDLAAITAASGEYVDWAVKWLEKSDRENKFQRQIDATIDQLEGDTEASFKRQKREAAWNSIISQGLTGYSAEDIANLRTSLGLSDLGTRQEDGTYDIAISELSGMPLWARNQILDSLEAEAIAAGKAISSLGSEIFDAEDADYAEAFSSLGKKGWGAKEIKTKVVNALMESIAGDTADLSKLVRDQLAEERGVDASAIDSAEVNEIVENMTVGFKDAYVERIQKANDLIFKKITNSASFSELEELGDLAVELDLDLTQFTGRLIEDLITYAQSIIDNVYLNAEDKNKALKEAYNTALGVKGYAATYGLDLNSLTQDAAIRMADWSSASETLRKTNNQMTQDQAAEFAAAMANMVGMNFETILGSLQYNKSNSTFSYDASLGTSARDLQLSALWNAAKNNKQLMAILGKHNYTDVDSLLHGENQKQLSALISELSSSGIPEVVNILGNYSEFVQLAESLQLADIFGTETKANKYASTVESFASGQTTTFEELVNLYSELGQVVDPATLYSLWQQGPEAIAEELARLAADSDLSDAQKEEIEMAQKRGVEALLASITSAVDNAINGTASLDDLVTLAKNAGINLSGKVAKTSSGYGLNQAGMLEVAAWKAMQSGDYAGEALKLVESYAGKGGIFNSVDSITTRITTTANALEGLAKEIDALQQQEVKILETDSEQAKKDKEQKKKELEQTKKELEQRKLLLEAEQSVLAQAQSVAKQNAAKNAANFMGIDPLNGAGTDFQNYLNSRSSAKEVLQAAYGNKGIIADFNQAMQIMGFIAYGQEDWDTVKQTQAYNTLFAYTGEDGTNFAAAYREIFGEQAAGMTDSEVLLHAAQLMDEAANKMSKELKERITANEKYAATYESIMKDTNARVALKEEESAESAGLIKEGKLDTDALYSRINAQYGKDKLGLTQKVVADMAETRYGAEWVTALSSVKELSNFLTSIDEIVANFQFDPSSSQSYEEQLIAYAKGETAAMEVEERLNALQQQLNDLTTEGITDPLIQGLEAAIERAEYLDSLLGGSGSQLGHTVFTGINKGTETGIIYVDPANIEAELQSYREALGRAWDLNKEQLLQINYDASTQTFRYSPDGPESAPKFEYKVKPYSDLSTTGSDPNYTIKYAGQFEEVDKWIEENKHVEAIYTLSTPQEAKAKLASEIKALQDSLKDRDVNESDDDYNNRIAATKAELIELTKLQAELNKRYPDEAKEPGTVQLKITGTAPESDEELTKWKEGLAQALEGIGNVPLVITDSTGNIITDISSITKGQQITISAGLADGTTKDTIQTLVDEVNIITGGLEKPTVKIEVTGLTADTVTTVTDLKSALEGLKNSPAASGVTINIGGDAATNAAEIIKNINAATNNGKPHEASLNFAVSYTVNGKAVDFDKNSLPILSETEESAEDDAENKGGKEDPGSITLTIKEVDPTSAAAAKKAINDLGKDVQITFKQGDKEFTDVNDLVPETPVEIQIQYKVDDEAGKSTSQEIVNAIGEIAGEKIVDISVEGLDETTAGMVTQLAEDLSALETSPETINIEVKDKDGKSLTLANDFAASLGAIKPDYESTVTVTVKYVDENGNSVRLTPQDTKKNQFSVSNLNTTFDELSDFVEAAGETAQQEADHYKQLVQLMQQEKTEVERKMESSSTLRSEYYPRYADKYLRGDSEWSQQKQSYDHAKGTAIDTVDEAEEVIEEIQAIKEEAASIALITDDTEAQAALDNLNAKISQLVSSHPTLFINVKVKSFTLEDIILPTGEKAPSTDGAGQYTGNVNGLAYAEGNVDSLIAGAHLANKTLVGELGPELGVWNGQYHLLGQHGAEFVNMPSDAIVFNHRQTAGILQGQWGHRGKALAEGNISGPARANSYTIDPWEALTGFKSYADFVTSLGSKGGSTTYKFTDVGDLEKWYNLLRKIAKLEKEITLEQAKRENMLDGHDWLKSYREEQSYLHEQIAVQKLLIDYQKEQLALERERIEQDEWWSHSLTFNEDGTLLSVFGNEVGGGEGAFAYLDMLNNMSGNEQVAALKKLGYSYIGKDGKALEGEELVKQFISEYQEIVGSYNELDDSILDAEAKVDELTSAINDLEEEIKNNQKELEKTIYDLLVEAAEREIEQMEEQHELLKEANQKYIDGLSEALNKEQQLYEENKSIEEREALQRQLSLLRRSGGSASEIEALEQQLDDTLKNEYFNKQQQMIEDVSKASERQAELMEQQVKLQEEALEYQKENGVLWTKVYEVMSGSYEEILAFITGTDTEFFEASALVQETMLLDWAKMVGIYDEDRAGKALDAEAQSHWEDGAVLGNLTEEQQGHYAKLSDQDKTTAQKHYNSVYTSSRLDGMTDEEARKAARDSMVERLRVDEELGITRWDPRGDDANQGNNGSDGTKKYVKVIYAVSPQEAKDAGCNISGPNYIEVGKTGKVTVTTAKGWAKFGWKSSDSTVASISSGVITAKKQGAVTITQTYKKKDEDYEPSVNGKSQSAVRDEITGTLVEKFSKGGLVNYTGLAMVHGSKSKPESFLNAEQTAQITAALRETTGKESILGSLQSTMDKLKSVIHNFSTVDNSTAQSISIAPGAVVIQVEQLADSYDIEEISRDVMNRMVAIANKATNRGVNRR